MRPTVCVAGAGVDSVWKHEKLEDRKMPAVGAARCVAAVPSVQCIIIPVIVRDAVLAGFWFCKALLAVKNSANIHELPVVIAPARA